MIKHIIFTSSLIIASALAGEARASCSGIQLTDTGSTSVTESASIIFKNLTRGKAVTIAGLTYTALPTGTVSATQVSNAFKGLTSGATTGPGTSLGTYSGTLTGWNADSTSSATRAFTSIGTGNVTDITTFTNGSTLGVNITQGSSSTATSLGSLLIGNTVCVGTTGHWEAQEFHKSDGNLIDWKKGASDPVDPTKSVGSWSITGTGTSARVNYTYDSTTYSNIVWDHGNSTYSFCNQNGNETMPSYIKTGQGAC